MLLLVSPVLRKFLDPKIPLKSVNVSGEIVDGFGQVSVSQTYENDYDNVIDAVYVFNLTSRDVVTDLKLRIGRRVLLSQIKKKKTAQYKYDTAVKDGKTACLLEQLSDGSYKVNVGNIQPHETVSVEFQYISVLPYADGRFKFVLPTNIAPKYSAVQNNNLDATAITYVPNVPYTFSIKLHWAVGNKITEIRSQTNDIDVVAVEKNGVDHENDVIISCVTTQKNGDFNVLLSCATDPSLYAYQDKEFAYLMLTTRVPSIDLPTERSKEYIFVIDRSGSMSSSCKEWSGSEENDVSKMQHAKDALILFLESLEANTLFNVVSFGSTYSTLFDKSVPLTNENKRHSIEKISAFGADFGGTEILPVLQDILTDKLNTTHAQRVHTSPFNNTVARSLSNTEKIIVLLTDGQVSNTQAVVTLCGKYKASSRVFCIGVGNDVDRNLVERVAAVTYGQSEIAVDSDDIASIVIRMLDSTTKTYFKDVSVEYEGIKAPAGTAAIYPDKVYSFYHKVATAEFSGLRGVKIQCTHAETNEKVEWNVALEKICYVPSFLSQHYAYHLIRDTNLSAAQIVDLSVKYNLMNTLTSFVIVDEMVEHGIDANKIEISVPQYDQVRNDRSSARSFAMSSITGALGGAPCVPGGRGGGGSNPPAAPTRVGFGVVQRSCSASTTAKPLGSMKLKKSCAKEKGDRAQIAQQESCAIDMDVDCESEESDNDKDTDECSASLKSSDAAIATDYAFDLQKLLVNKTVEGYFSYSDNMLPYLSTQYVNGKLFSEWANVLSVSCEFLCNLYILLQLEKSNEAKYKLILKNLKKWVDVSIDTATVERVRNSLQF